MEYRCGIAFSLKKVSNDCSTARSADERDGQLILFYVSVCVPPVPPTMPMFPTTESSASGLIISSLEASSAGTTTAVVVELIRDNFEK